MELDYTDDGSVVTTLFIEFIAIGNEITCDHLRNYFAKYGKVQKVRIHRKAEIFGFVAFARPEAASEALKCRCHSINKTTIVDVYMAHSWHQEKPLEESNSPEAKPDALPIELTNATGTYLLDLNDDCLYEIFSSLSIMGLCSVAETCTRFKAIAIRIFTKAHKNCQFNDEMGLDTIYKIRRVLINFGSSITNLTIGPNFLDGQRFKRMSERVVDLVIQYCSKTIESLRLWRCNITDHCVVVNLQSLFANLKLLHISGSWVEGDEKLFSNCASLVELKLFNSDNNVSSDIFENTFPKLERFRYYHYRDENCYALNWESFLLHHKGLKVFTIANFNANCSSLLHAIANNCLDLEKLSITGDRIVKPYGYMSALNSLLALKKLKKLKIKCDNEIVTKFLQELPQLSALESLELWNAQSVAGFIPALSQLKNLKVLKLQDCNHLKNVNSLASLEKLTELSILIRSWYTIIDIDVDFVGLVNRLVNLEILVIGLHSFVLDHQMYLQFVDVVRIRPGPFPSSLLLMALVIDDELRECQRNSKDNKFVFEKLSL